MRLVFVTALLAIACDPAQKSQNVEADRNEPLTYELHGELVHVPDIANKTPEAVAAILGPPDCRESTCSYAGGVEVVFNNGLSNWITINGGARTVFGEKAIESELGLSSKWVSAKNEHSIVWKPTGYRSITMFKGHGGNLDHFFICVRSCPSDQ